MLNLENLSESRLIQVEADEAIGPAVWSTSLADPRVAVLAGRLSEEGMLCCIEPEFWWLPLTNRDVMRR